MSSDSLEEKEKILTVYYIDGFNTLARIGLFRTQHPEVTLQAVKFETCQELEDELIKTSIPIPDQMLSFSMS